MENQFDKEKMLSKIEKLLKLSGNNPNANEAEAAFLKAQELMLAYKIEMHELDGDKKSELKIVKLRCEQAANTPWARALVKIFAENFGCMVYYNSFGKSHYPVYFGNEEDAHVCRELYDYAVVWLNKSACNYATKKRNTEGMVKGVKQDYILGFLKGLGDKYKEQVESNSQYALIIVVPKEVKSEYNTATASMTSKNWSGHMNTHGSVEARSDGYAAGKSFGTNRIKS